MKRVLLIAALGFVALVSGFYQEKLKVSINYILECGDKMPGFFEQNAEEKERWIEQTRVDASFDYYHNHQTVSWLYPLNRHQLATSKWIVTAFFILWFLLLNRSILRALDVSDKVIGLLPWMYTILTLFAFVVFAIGIIGFEPTHCYAASRKIMGALQSVIPVLILWPSAKLWVLQNKKISV